MECGADPCNTEEVGNAKAIVCEQPWRLAIGTGRILNLQGFVTK